MRISIRYAVLSCAFGTLFACTHAGDQNLRPEQRAEASPMDACPGPNCALAPPAPRAAPASVTPASSPIRPAVPPVPGSPIKANCATLPTQVERDTCTNRKESTG